MMTGWESCGCSALGNLGASFQYLKGAKKRAGEGLFTGTCSNGTRGNGFNLRIVLNRYEKEIFCCEALEQVVWRSCRWIDAPPLAVFKVRLDAALSNMV